MNILMALSQLEVTGAEVYATTVGNELTRRGHQVCYVSDTLTKPTLGPVFKLRFNKRSILRRFWHVFYLIYLIKKHHIQLVHAHSRASGWSSYVACKLTGTPMITTVHGRGELVDVRGSLVPLVRLGRWLEQPEVKERASQLIVRYIQREWPTLSSTVNWVKPIDEIGDSLAERLARAVLEELQQVLAEPQHPLRQDYEQWLGNYVQRLREDPALAERIEQLKQEMIDHPALQEYVQGLWSRIQASLRGDLQREDSALVGHLQRSLASLGDSLQSDPALREALNQHLLEGAQRLFHAGGAFTAAGEAEVEEYRTQQDPLAGFLADECEVDEDLKCPLPDLRARYAVWSGRQPDPRWFANMLRQHGLRHRQQWWLEPLLQARNRRR